MRFFSWIGHLEGTGIAADNDRAALSGTVDPVDIMTGWKSFVYLSVHRSAEIWSLQTKTKAFFYQIIYAKIRQIY